MMLLISKWDPELLALSAVLRWFQKINSNLCVSKGECKHIAYNPRPIDYRHAYNPRILDRAGCRLGAGTEEDRTLSEERDERSIYRGW